MGDLQVHFGVPFSRCTWPPLRVSLGVYERSVLVIRSLTGLSKKREREYSCYQVYKGAWFRSRNECLPFEPLTAPAKRTEASPSTKYIPEP